MEQHKIFESSFNSYDRKVHKKITADGRKHLKKICKILNYGINNTDLI